MPTLSLIRPSPPPIQMHPVRLYKYPRFLFNQARVKQRIRLFISASSYPFNDMNSKYDSESRESKKLFLSNLIQEIEPLDVSLIQKDVPADTIDAMKRTISGMLGLLPSDQFLVFIDAFWEPLSKLLISSMMTGYTLRNAEYRLCLEKNLEIHDIYFGDSNLGNQNSDHETSGQNVAPFNSSFRNDAIQKSDGTGVDPLCVDAVNDLGEITPEVQEYILHLESLLSSAKRELHELKRKSAALDMQRFVGEEKNDLLDYLRSLQPEKVTELSEPASVELQETIHSVVHGLLATLSPRVHSSSHLQTEGNASGTVPNLDKEDGGEVVENTSLHFHPLVSITRDYLARLIFWCMLLGHYLRGLEYRLNLTDLLSFSGDPNLKTSNGDEDMIS